MKVRVGVGTGTGAPGDAERFAGIVDDLERLGFDSIWLSEILTLPGLDPTVAMAVAAARTSKLKIGTTMVVPGRNPIRLAKEMATLDRLSEGRLLLTFVLGLKQPAELQALGVTAGERGRQLDEMLPLLRRLWAEESVHHEGEFWQLDGVTIEPRPLQDPLEMWLGGSVPSALRRAGRLSDGWLPAFCTPAEAARDKVVIDEAAAEAGRSISAEHFGISLGYAKAAPTGRYLELMRARRPELDADAIRDLVPVGYDGLRDTLQRFVDVGFSKFVVRPVEPPVDWSAELDALAAATLDLQT